MDAGPAGLKEPASPLLLIDACSLKLQRGPAKRRRGLSALAVVPQRRQSSSPASTRQPVTAGETARRIEIREKLVHPEPAIGPNRSRRDTERTRPRPNEQLQLGRRSTKPRSECCRRRF